MIGKDYDNFHRNYYHDHPTSLNHREPYIIPVQNQYSVLNRSRNPYHVLDNYNFQIKRRGNPTSVPLPAIPNQSLSKQIEEWNLRQYQKQNTFRSLKEEIHDLSKLIKVKQSEYEIDKLKNQYKNSMSNRSFALYPMIIPMPNMGWPMPQMYNSHVCQCQCRCNCLNNMPIHRAPRQPSRRYKPIITQNSSDSIPKILSKRQEVLTSIQTIQSMQSMRSQPKIMAKPKQQKELIRLTKGKKSNLLRRFRICAYAVYFSIYFKCFSFQFSLNRYNRFKINFLVDSGSKITQAYKKVYQKILQIDIPQLIRQAASSVPQSSKAKQQEFDITQLLKPESIVKYKDVSKFNVLSTNKQTLFLRCTKFISMFFQQITTVLQSWNWQKYGQALGVGALNQTFLIDNYFLPHQIYLIIIDQKKGYAHITPDHQSCEVMIKFVAKILLYNVCLQLDNNRQWLQKNEKELQNSGDSNQVFIFLELSSKIIFITCQFLYQQILGKNDLETNYDEVSQKFRIQPCNPLVYSHSIRKRRQLFKNQDIKQSNLLIYGIQKLDQVNKITKQPFFRQSNTVITKAVTTFTNYVLFKLKDQNQRLYQQLWEQTLSNQYIILRGIKKIMKSTVFYPFASNSTIRSIRKINNQDNTDYNTQASNRGQNKKRKFGKNKGEDTATNQDKTEKTSAANTSYRTKVSIKNMLSK